MRTARPLLRPALLAGGLIAAFAALSSLPTGLDTKLAQHLALGQDVGGQGVGADALFLLLGAVLCAVGAPRQAIAFGAGYAFGPRLGFMMAMLAESAGCAASFFWARVVARDWVMQRRGRRLARLDALLTQHGFSATLTIRLLPFGNNLLLNLLGGVSAVSAGSFLLASVLGYVPQTIIFVLLGSGMQVSSRWQLWLGAGLLGVSLLLGSHLMRRHRRLLAVAREATEAETVSEGA
jgi:uncharacterized membrane protein YdjX (TVP38/TMEM64 family)